MVFQREGPFVATFDNDELFHQFLLLSLETFFQFTLGS